MLKYVFFILASSIDSSCLCRHEYSCIMTGTSKTAVDTSRSCLVAPGREGGGTRKYKIKNTDKSRRKKKLCFWLKRINKHICVQNFQPAINSFHYNSEMVANLAPFSQVFVFPMVPYICTYISNAVATWLQTLLQIMHRMDHRCVAFLITLENFLLAPATSPPLSSCVGAVLLYTIPRRWKRLLEGGVLR